MNRVMMAGLGLAGFGVFMLVAGKPTISTQVLSGVVGKAETAPPQPKAAVRKPVFVFLKIPDPIMPEERDKKYEKPIKAALVKAGVGTVTGAGTGLKDDGAGIEYVGVDVNLTDFKKGVTILKAELRRIGAPKETRLQYSVGEMRIDVEFEEAE